MSPETAEPKSNLWGFVYAIVRTNRFFNGALGVPQFYEEKINFKIDLSDRRTGRGISIYERFPSKIEERERSEIIIDKEMKVYDKTWTLHFEPLPHF